MGKLLWVVIAWSAVALPAIAEQRTCTATIEGAAGKVEVELDYEGDRLKGGRASWDVPPDASSTADAKLWLSREFSDPRAGDLGRYSGVVVGAFVMAEGPLPDRAIIAVSSNTVRPIARPWRLYAEMAAQLRSGAKPADVAGDAKPVGFFGVVPFVRGDPATDALLDSLEAARTVIATATDDEGTVLLSRGLYWLSTRDAFEAQARQGHAQALAAAQDLHRNCKTAAEREAAASPAP